MARKPKSVELPDGRGSSKTGYDGNRLKWVNSYLNDDDKRWLESHRNEIAPCILRLVEEQASGYKISCKFDGQSSRYQASLLPDDVDCPNAGFGLSHRAGDPTIALFVLSYLHFIKFECRWGEIEPGSESGSAWD